MNEQILQWIPTKEKLPDYDEFVLWRNEQENYFVDCIDKDDPRWWNAEAGNRGICTHWAKIPSPINID